MSLTRYSDGSVCPHCKWIATRPKVFQSPNVSVFNCHHILTHTFNCVNCNHDKNHLSSLFEGALEFINYIGKQYNCKNLRMLVNSTKNKKIKKQKEHPHALITINDNIELFSEPIMTKYSEEKNKAKIIVDKEVYGNRIEIPPHICLKLLKSGKHIHTYIDDLVQTKLNPNFKFSSKYHDWYLILYFKETIYSGQLAI
jgi:hypothetical protein